MNKPKNYLNILLFQNKAILLLSDTAYILIEENENQNHVIHANEAADKSQ